MLAEAFPNLIFFEKRKACHQLKPSRFGGYCILGRLGMILSLPERGNSEKGEGRSCSGPRSEDCSDCSWILPKVQYMFAAGTGLKKREAFRDNVLKLKTWQQNTRREKISAGGFNFYPSRISISCQVSPPQTEAERPRSLKPIFLYMGIFSSRQVRMSLVLPFSFSRRA